MGLSSPLPPPSPAHHTGRSRQDCGCTERILGTAALPSSPGWTLRVLILSLMTSVRAGRKGILAITTVSDMEFSQNAGTGEVELRAIPNHALSLQRGLSFLISDYSPPFC